MAKLYYFQLHPEFTFAPVVKRVFVRNYWYVMSPVQSFAWKSSDFHYFHGKRFAQALALQMETQTVEVKVCIQIRMLFFRPRLNILIQFSADFRRKHSCNILKLSAYDISVLEFIGVSIISVWYLDLYCVTLCMCSIACFSLQSVRSKCHVKRRH